MLMQEHAASTPKTKAQKKSEPLVVIANQGETSTSN